METISPYRKPGNPKHSINGISQYLGKIPPQAIEVEKAIIGIMLQEPTTCQAYFNILKPEMFYREPHQIMFRAIQELCDKHQPVDILTLTKKLNNNGQLDLVGGPYEITTIVNGIVSSANIEFHIAILKQKYLQRELIRIGGLSQATGYDEGKDVIESLNEIESEFTELNNSLVGNDADYAPGKEITEVIGNIINRQHNQQSGIDTGNQFLNDLTGGWNAGELIILAARPAMGKTARAIEFAKRSASKVAFFSLEMGKAQIIARFLTNIAQISNNLIKRHQLSTYDQDRLKSAGSELMEYPIYINDKVRDINYIRTVCSSRKRKDGLDLVIVDYLQLIPPVERLMNEEQNISNISKGLKKMAKDLNIPVIALCQLSREVEKRPSRKPQLSDLRYSGQIEADADLVIGMFRPSYYTEYAGNSEYQSQVSEQEYNRISEMIILKNRNGECGTIKEMFYGEHSRYEEFVRNNNQP